MSRKELFQELDKNKDGHITVSVIGMLPINGFMSIFIDKGIFGNDNRLSGRLKCINFVSLSSTTPHRFFSCVPIFLIKLLAIRSRQYIM